MLTLFDACHARAEVATVGAMARKSDDLRIIVNPSAGGGSAAAAWAVVCQRHNHGMTCETTTIAQVADEAAQAAKDGVGVLAVAGGDGTISVAISGLMRARDAGIKRLPDLLILPIGTGNDLARGLDLPDDPEAAFGLLYIDHVRPLDLIRWKLHSEKGIEGGYAVNVLAGGFSSKLQHALTPELKKRWGPLAYARAAVETRAELEPHTLHYRIDDGDPATAEILNVVVANARYAGGGISVAPAADPSDGLLNLVLTTPGTAFDLAALSARLMSGNVLKSELVHQLTGKKFELWAEPALPFNVDGDWTGAGKLEAEVIPAPLNVFAPPTTG